MLIRNKNEKSISRLKTFENWYQLHHLFIAKVHQILVWYQLYTWDTKG